MARIEIIGAWSPAPTDRGDKTGLRVVYTTPFGTAHAGAFRRGRNVPRETRTDLPSVPDIVWRPSASLPPTPKPHPLLTATDKELAAAFERLLAEPSFSKVRLTDWEFRLAADAPGVFLRYGGFTWKQRKYLREIVKKILGL